MNVDGRASWPMRVVPCGVLPCCLAAVRALLVTHRLGGGAPPSSIASRSSGHLPWASVVWYARRRDLGQTPTYSYLGVVMVVVVVAVVVVIRAAGGDSCGWAVAPNIPAGGESPSEAAPPPPPPPPPPNGSLR